MQDHLAERVKARHIRAQRLLLGQLRCRHGPAFRPTATVRSWHRHRGRRKEPTREPRPPAAHRATRPPPHTESKRRPHLDRFCSGVPVVRCVFRVVQHGHLGCTAEAARTSERPVARSCARGFGCRGCCSLPRSSASGARCCISSHSSVTGCASRRRLRAVAVSVTGGRSRGSLQRRDAESLSDGVHLMRRVFGRCAQLDRCLCDQSLPRHGDLLDERPADHDQRRRRDGVAAGIRERGLRGFHWLAFRFGSRARRLWGAVLHQRPEGTRRVQGCGSPGRPWPRMSASTSPSGRPSTARGSRAARRTPRDRVGSRATAELVGPIVGWTSARAGPVDAVGQWRWRGDGISRRRSLCPGRSRSLSSCSRGD